MVTWSLTSPNRIVEFNTRNDEKVTIFVAIVNDKVPVVHAYMDENGRCKIVNGDCYLNLLQENVWPTFRSCATRQGLWWMQDGAPAYCNTAAKEFLLNKFGGRVISRGTQIACPAHSPDMTPLDFYYCSLAQKKVHSVKPTTVMNISML